MDTMAATSTEARTSNMSTTQRVAQAAHRAVDKVADGLERTQHQARERTDQATKQLRGYMHDHPIATIAIAFSVGAVLSQLLRRR